MENRLKLPALALSVLMLAALFTGCAGTSNTTPPDAAPTSSGQETASASPASPAASPPSAQSALEQLLSMEDKLPLGGLQPAHLDSRADVGKALPMKKTNSDTITIGWASASQGSSFFTEMLKSAQQKCDQYGYKLLYQVANFDVNAQMTQIENFLTQQVDFLVVNAVDIDATASYYQQAVSQGIPVIVVGPTAAKADYPLVTTVLSGSFESGFVVGQYLAEKLSKDYEGKELKMGFVISRAGDADSNSRPCGVVSGYLYKLAELNGKPYASKWDATLDGYNAWVKCRDSGSSKVDGSLDLVGYAAAGATDANSGQTAAGDLLTAHPDMNLVFVETDSLSPGVLQEMSQHGVTPGKDMLVACGADAAKYTLDNIKAGKILACGTNAPYYTGAGVVDLIHSILDGFDANDLPANSYTPTYCVNVDNVDQYYDPNLEFAPMLDWTLQTIDEYNAANAG
ncbi:substrate-binding protein domain-containing protein [Sporobacter termitidis DSM 10068]|uniref:Substrate-binding protein domain-containing protein n=1 Tax=Sporobacter termitidis DSM 10068 TaxID=1123282 RepID=A0A1M5VCB9_9FIRM|nr:sugar ABC transporter substrate-binding protein [Sporobacter termitidis]SHH72909.1 substrate-binding protein domain-containing protein [Sporobacter termitidis DSM 10068]